MHNSIEHTENDHNHSMYTVHPQSGGTHTEVVPDERRGDLLLLRHNTRLLVDVTVRRPTGLTELRLRHGATPLATATAAEDAKHAKYDEACKRESLTMVPFALESYGAKGKEARKLLLKLADASEELTAAAFLRHASAALSVALQCGNADIAARGVQSMRVHQLEDQHPTRSAHPTRRRHQHRARCTPSDLRVDAFHSLFHAAATAPSRRNGLTVHVDVDCLKADTACPGWMDHDREVEVEGMAA